MKYKLVLTSMVMGAIVCSTSAVVGAANVAPQVAIQQNMRQCNLIGWIARILLQGYRPEVSPN